jgi:hypothetical protein
LCWVLLDLVEVGDLIRAVDGENVQGFDVKTLESLFLKKVLAVELKILRPEGIAGHEPAWLLSLQNLTCMETLNIRCVLSCI